MIIRGFAALVISAVLGIGTLVVVNNASNDANDTAKEITRQSLEYQKEAMKDADAQSKAFQDGVNEQIDAAVTRPPASTAIDPDDALRGSRSDRRDRLGQQVVTWRVTATCQRPDSIFPRGRAIWEAGARDGSGANDPEARRRQAPRAADPGGPGGARARATARCRQRRGRAAAAQGQDAAGRPAARGRLE